MDEEIHDKVNSNDDDDKEKKKKRKIFKKFKIMIITQENSEDLHTYYAVQDINNKERYLSQFIMVVTMSFA